MKGVSKWVGHRVETLTIITINLNNARGLESTIRSVVTQAYPSIEYIVIDGGSTDGSVDIIKKYADRLSYWVSEPDAGIFNAMNKGIQKATGTYCQFLNSGDCLVEQEVTKKMLKDCRESAIVYGNIVTTERGKLKVDKGYEGNSITLLDMYCGTINHCAAYIRRDLFGKYGLYDETLKIVSDWKFFLISVGLHNESVAYRNVNVAQFDMNGVSNRNPDLMRKEREFVVKDLIDGNTLKDLEECVSFREIFRRLSRYPLIWFIVKSVNAVIRKCETCR